MTNRPLHYLEDKIKYNFNDKDLLRHAMTHSSFTNEHRLNKLACNERLEFLGDAVLEITVSEYLYNNYTNMPEGEMSRFRASIVCEPTLAMCSRDIELGSYLLMGKGEALTGGRERESVCSDAFEALIGAIYLDGGFTNAKDFIYRWVLNDLEDKKLFFDSKTILQELIQKDNKEVLSYKLIKEEGPDHEKRFTVNAMLGDKVVGSGVGKTKKAAEQIAAYNAIIDINKAGKQ